MLATWRWYSLQLLRWLNRDPILYDGGDNLYGYVHANPVMNVDPLGLEVDGSWGSALPFFPSEDEHMNRNQHNKCPKKEPKLGCTDSGWKYDKKRGKWRHERGWECKYLANGKPAPDNGLNQTFNFGGGNDPGFMPFSGGNWQHFWQDWLPSYHYGHQTNPNLTTYE
jgi:hypothetical protein